MKRRTPRRLWIQPSSVLAFSILAGCGGLGGSAEDTGSGLRLQRGGTMNAQGVQDSESGSDNTNPPRDGEPGRPGSPDPNCEAEQQRWQVCRQDCEVQTGLATCAEAAGQACNEAFHAAEAACQQNMMTGCEDAKRQAEQVCMDARTACGDLIAVCDQTCPAPECSWIGPTEPCGQFDPQLCDDVRRTAEDCHRSTREQCAQVIDAARACMDPIIQACEAGKRELEACYASGADCAEVESRLQSCFEGVEVCRPLEEQAQACQAVCWPLDEKVKVVCELNCPPPPVGCGPVDPQACAQMHDEVARCHQEREPACAQVAEEARRCAEPILQQCEADKRAVEACYNQSQSNGQDCRQLEEQASSCYRQLDACRPFEEHAAACFAECKGLEERANMVCSDACQPPPPPNCGPVDPQVCAQMNDELARCHQEREPACAQIAEEARRCAEPIMQQCEADKRAVEACYAQGPNPTQDCRELEERAMSCYQQLEACRPFDERVAACFGECQGLEERAKSVCGGGCEPPMPPPCSPEPVACDGRPVPPPSDECLVQVQVLESCHAQVRVDCEGPIQALNACHQGMQQPCEADRRALESCYQEQQEGVQTDCRQQEEQLRACFEHPMVPDTGNLPPCEAERQAVDACVMTCQDLEIAVSNVCPPPPCDVRCGQPLPPPPPCGHDPNVDPEACAQILQAVDQCRQGTAQVCSELSNALESCVRPILQECEQLRNDLGSCYAQQGDCRGIEERARGCFERLSECRPMEEALASCQAPCIQLAQAADQICHGISPDGRDGNQGTSNNPDGSDENGRVTPWPRAPRG